MHALCGRLAVRKAQRTKNGDKEYIRKEQALNKQKQTKSGVITGVWV
jgi:hypothetical protein